MNSKVIVDPEIEYQIVDRNNKVQNWVNTI